MVVGAFGFVVDIGTFTVLRRVFAINENIAQTVSFTAAIVSNFTWNRYWTYPDSRTKKLGKQLLLFALISTIGWLIRTPIFNIMDPVYTNLLAYFGFPLGNIALQATLAEYLALMTAIGVVLFWNFFINRFWTYNDVK
jgi:putative flippase GtrA